MAGYWEDRPWEREPRYPAWDKWRPGRPDTRREGDRWRERWRHLGAPEYEDWRERKRWRPGEEWAGEYGGEGWRGMPAYERWWEPERGERQWYGTRSGWGVEHEFRPEINPPWVERGPERRRRGDSRGLVEWEDRGPLEWLGDKVRGATRRPSRGPKGYVRSDERIRDEVCERIARSGAEADEVEVRVANREVTLTGTVPSRQDRWWLEDLADEVFGVEEVHNQLRVSRGERYTGSEDTSPTTIRH